MRLSAAHLDRLDARVVRPAYDRRGRKQGIVHFGLGAFTRAHQAAYTDEAMARTGGDWMIAGVSLRSPAVAHRLNPQGGLYQIAEQSAGGTHYRLCGAIDRVIVAPQSPERVIEALALPTSRIASFTVTEKGYGRNGGGHLDLAHDDVVRDLSGHAAPRTIYGYLAAGLARRKKAGLPGLTLLSCDNLTANGAVLRRCFGEFLARAHPGLAEWVETACSFPSTMVDRIVPATTDDDRDRAEAAAGLRDEALVVTEPFSQWVIEDRFVDGRPDWGACGARLVEDVAPYEKAKLRMLNGAHSLLAYCGLDRGYEFVHQAVADPALRRLTLQLMEEAASTIHAAPGQDLQKYAARLIHRFENPALHHRLMQIAMDGSQKIPQRWLDTLIERQRRGLSSAAIITGLAAWLRHVGGTRRKVEDPFAEQLAAAAREDDVAVRLERTFGARGVVETRWTPTEEEIEALRSA